MDIEKQKCLKLKAMFPIIDRTCKKVHVAIKHLPPVKGQNQWDKYINTISTFENAPQNEKLQCVGVNGRRQILWLSFVEQGAGYWAPSFKARYS